MINQEVRDLIAEVNEDAVVFDNPSFDNSIIGMTTDGCVVYAMDLMIDELAKDDDITPEEALEFIDYNTLRAMPYMSSATDYIPVIVDSDVLWYEFMSRLQAAKGVDK